MRVGPLARQRALRLLLACAGLRLRPPAPGRAALSLGLHPQPNAKPNPGNPHPKPSAHPTSALSVSLGADLDHHFWRVPNDETMASVALDQEVHVIPGDAGMTVSLFVEGKPIALERGADEKLGKTLDRLYKTMQKKSKKKKNRNRPKSPSPSPSPDPSAKADADANLKPSPNTSPTSNPNPNPSPNPNPNPTSTQLMHRETGEPLDYCLSNGEAWPLGAELVFPDGERRAVRFDPPRLLELGVSPVFKRLLSGCEVFPSLKVTGATAELKYEWFLQSGTSPTDDWALAGAAPTFTPSENDVGAALWLRVTPLGTEGATPGRALSHFFTRRIEAAPEPMLLVQRREWLAEPRPEGSFRVLSYNLLADAYTRQENIQKKLFPYAVRNECIDSSYRFNLALREIAEVGADLLCLQEVDASFYLRTLRPFAALHGLTGTFVGKAGGSSEGCAILARDARFAFEDEYAYDVVHRRLFLGPDADPSTLGLGAGESFPFPETRAQMQELLGPLCALYPDLRVQLTEHLNSVTQLRVLRIRRDDAADTDSPLEFLIVANNHLYYHPLADHIRCIQMCAVLESLRELQARIEAEHGGGRTAVMLIGDLNSCVRSPAYELLTAGLCRSGLDAIDRAVGADYETPADHKVGPKTNIQAPRPRSRNPNPKSNPTLGLGESKQVLLGASETQGCCGRGRQRGGGATGAEGGVPPAAEESLARPAGGCVLRRGQRGAAGDELHAVVPRGARLRMRAGAGARGAAHCRGARRRLARGVRGHPVARLSERPREPSRRRAAPGLRLWSRRELACAAEIELGSKQHTIYFCFALGLSLFFVSYNRCGAPHPPLPSQGRC